MPPRTPLMASVKASNGLARVQNSFATLSLNPVRVSSRALSEEARAKMRRKHDPFAIAQARQRKAANLSRQKALREQRETSLGDPVRGNPTPFTQSLEGIYNQSTVSVPSGESGVNNLNYFVKSNELQAALEYSKKLSEPVTATTNDLRDPQLEVETEERHRQAHQNAEEAIKRIVQLGGGSSKDRTRVNIQRCIETFGRHNTNKTLPPKPAAVQHPSAPVHPEKAPLAGPDTGSAEVQVAILTTKILKLASHLETTKKDKHNKRNLRVLVHKRQKLLAYLRRKERGGPRWQNLMQTLGLTDGAWKGEISL